ncbi:MAG: hypothetical protein K6A98_05470 [Prevotella sp.]|nr:hypothetical protein [Prevotella sp.]MCR5152586.1 hypothetical protein [Prevotella sp.]
MKTIYKKISVALILSIATVGTVMAQQTVSVENEQVNRQIAQAEARLKSVDAQLKAQQANLNKTYSNVSPEVQEELNDKEDFKYLELLSQKRTIELEIKELKKSKEHYVIGTQTRVTGGDALIRSGAQNSSRIPPKKKK